MTHAGSHEGTVVTLIFIGGNERRRRSRRRNKKLFLVAAAELLLYPGSPPSLSHNERKAADVVTRELSQFLPKYLHHVLAQNTK